MKSAIQAEKEGVSSAMSNLVSCPNCNKSLITEEYGRHECASKPTVRRIPIKLWWASKTDKNEDLIMAVGLDGIVYRLVKSNILLPDESKQEDYADWLRRRGNRTQVRVLSSLRRLFSCKLPSADTLAYFLRKCTALSLTKFVNRCGADLNAGEFDS